MNFRVSFDCLPKLKVIRSVKCPKERGTFILNYPIDFFLENRLYNIRFDFRAQTVEGAKADAERVRLIGEAEAQALEQIGIAEANRMTMKAAVYKKYGEAAILNLVLQAMPKVRLFVKICGKKRKKRNDGFENKFGFSRL